MTKQDFNKIDSVVAFIAYASLFISVFVGIDYFNLRAENDLSEFGQVWTPVIVIGFAVLFAVIQTIRLRAYRINFAGGR